MIKLFKKRSFIVLLIIILTPVISWSAWFFASKKPTNIIIYDKTVLNSSADEHKSFNWILNYHRFVSKETLEPYDPVEDYKGFFPLDSQEYKTNAFESYSLSELDSISKAIDILYLTDMYGIYSLEWYAETEQLERSKKVYGGATEKDLALMENAVRNNKLVIGEFNLFASPTFKYIGKQCESLFNLTWSGWTGRYFTSLDTTINKELPKWLVKGYLEQHNNKWPFTKPGIVFVHEWNKIEILESETDLTYEIPWIISSPKTIDRYGVKDTIEYPFWFDIVEADNPIDKISSYSIRTNSRGDSLMNKWNIPTEFPAVITGNDSLTYYFSGDFADNKIGMNLSHFKGTPLFGGITQSQDGLMSRNTFFWDFYYPLVSNIILPYSEKLNP